MLLTSSCADDASIVSSEIPWDTSPLPAVIHPADNAPNDAKTELGRLLFYDPVLSSDRQVACATCHSEYWGMGDGLQRSVGIDGEGPAGLGRTGPNVTLRNASTLWNAAYRESLLWDGRFDSLEAQVLGPLADPREMGRDPRDVAADLRDIPAYVDLFERAFPELDEAVTSESLQRAIASFERTLVSDRAPYDQYIDGDLGAMTDAELEGMRLFGELGCHDCHAPPRFETDRFAPGAVSSGDVGRFAQSDDPNDEGNFRVPTLRNIRETNPYFHDGSVESLDEAVAIEVSSRTNVDLTQGELDQLITFLNKSLIDVSRRPNRPESVPSGLQVPLDGFRVPR